MVYTLESTANGKILEQHTNTHAITMNWLGNRDHHWEDERISANQNQVFVFLHSNPLLLPYVIGAPNMDFWKAVGKRSNEEALVELG
jgi:hypothetical protein